ncbi:hypothetical protein [Staphylothermus hellenicus]|uniref:Uncharacterized protein n=1 Tax=Staphylothermus hellenicus (strain DSM 12710 / JCM 10830 / BK20S6-10-b1 / P8) TaxID=591019 RepID=D7D905_STAHD|nr:hypothetical protein [Staphylothermus hellenicus]ADI32251.1 hypothetical protein Shell_1150 [Staphylothermus hellenicus DSM 12710]
MFKPSKLDDRVVIMRAVLGIIYGFISYFLIYKLNIALLTLDLSSTIWVLAGIVYVGSAFYIQYWSRSRSLFLVFIRGLLTFYATWLAIFLTLYDLLG